jgi:hypothetical protein
MYSVLLISFDSRLYHDSSSPSAAVATLQEIHQLIIKRYSEFQIDPSHPLDHPFLATKGKKDQETIMQSFVAYFEFLRTLSGQEWSASSLMPQQTTSPASQEQEFPTLVYESSWKDSQLSNLKTTFSESLKGQLQTEKIVDEMDASGSPSSSSPVANQYEVAESYYGLPNGLNQIMPVDIMVASKENNKVPKAFLEVYEQRNKFERSAKQRISEGEEIVVNRFDKLKIYFYNFYYPGVPFYRLKAADIEKRCADVALMCVEQFLGDAKQSIV